MPEDTLQSLQSLNNNSTGSNNTVPTQSSSSQKPTNQKTNKPEETQKMKMYKKILYIVLGVLGVGIIVYFLFFYKTTLTINTIPETAQIEIAGNVSTGSTQIKLMPGDYKLKISQQGYVTYEKNIKAKPSQKIALQVELKVQPDPARISNLPAKFSTLTEDEKSLVFVSNQDKAAHMVSHVNTDKISNPSVITPPAVFSDVVNMLWGPTKRLAIIKTNDRNTGIYDFGRYDLINQEKIDFGPGIEGISFNSDGERIVYYYAPDTGEKTLIRAKKNNTEIERLIDLRNYNFINPKVIWSHDDQNVLIITNELYLFDMYYKTIEKLENIGTISNADFTPDSTQIIFEQEGQLKLCDLKGENIQQTEIFTTLNKTTWFDENNLFYATKTANEASDSLFEMSIRDFYKKEFDYNKSIFINVTNPIVSSDKNRLFFESNGYLNFLNLVEKEYN